MTVKSLLGLARLFDAREQHGNEGTTRWPLDWRWRRRAMQSLAAMTVLALGLAPWLQTPSLAWQTYASGSHPVRRVSLSDGTWVGLDRESLLAVRFDERHRIVDVLRGGALFDTGHDSSRPLLVQLDANVLQESETVFDAHRSDDGARVTVISGRVKVWQCDDATCLPCTTVAGALPIADLHAGQQARMHRDGSLDLVDPHADLAQTTGWLPSDIHFEGATLAEAAHRSNTYGENDTQVIGVDRPAVDTDTHALFR